MLQTLRAVALTIVMLMSGLALMVALFGHPAGDIDRKLYMTAAAQADCICKGLERYKRDCGEYPPNLWTLGVGAGYPCWHGPYISKHARRDPWGRSFVYEITDSRIRVLSLGADGLPGGIAFDADVGPGADALSIPESAFEKSMRRQHVAAVVVSAILLAGSVMMLGRVAFARGAPDVYC